MKITIEITDNDEIKTTTEGAENSTILRVSALIAALEYEKLMLLQAFAGGQTLKGKNEKEDESSTHHSDGKMESNCDEDDCGKAA